MNFGATLATSAWLASSLPAWLKFKRALLSPALAQSQILEKYLRRNANTAYGRAYGLDGIRSYAEFSRRVPLADYETLEPWIERIQAGEASVLIADPVTRLLPTSGSSGARKLIPFTATLQREFNAAIGPWMIDLGRQHPAIVSGPAYWSVTPMGTAPAKEFSKIPIGFADDSEYLGGTRSRWVEASMAVPSVVRHISDPEHFRYVVLLCLLRCADLRLISVWHPSFLTLLLDALTEHWDALLSDLATGQCRFSNDLPRTVRERLLFFPEPKRVAKLRHADPTRPLTLWPGLRVVSGWADGHAAGAAAELKRRLPGVHLQPKGLLATEAFVTFPFADRHPVAVCSHFFEFIDEGGAFHLVDSLRAGEVYEVVVTTGGGLWRYRLGDQVEVTGFVGRTPSLRFLGRGQNISDRCGEKLSEAFVASAIRRVFPESAPAFALLAPEPIGNRWRYTLFAEAANLESIGERLDELLQENPHYALCRKLGQLAALGVREISSGGYETFVAAETSRGLRLGDIKPTALSSRADWSNQFKPMQPSPS